VVLCPEHDRDIRIQPSPRGADLDTFGIAQPVREILGQPELIEREGLESVGEDGRRRPEAQRAEVVAFGEQLACLEGLLVLQDVFTRGIGPVDPNVAYRVASGGRKAPVLSRTE
jgi:hypothetical protein